MKRQIVMGFSHGDDTRSNPPSNQHLETFNYIERVPLVGEHVRFGGKNHKVLSVVTNLDTGQINVALSDPL